MPRPLVLSLDGQEMPLQLEKIDREKLYGALEIEAFDENGDEVFLRVLAADGKTVIDKGGTALATLNEEGDSVDRSSLRPVSADGEESEPVPSSFDTVNILSLTDAEDYLSHNVKSVYVLDTEDDSDLDYLKSHLAGDNIYKFKFSYRSGPEYDEAFLIGNKQGIFMIVGTPANLPFVKLNQPTVIEPVEEEEISAEEIDFDLL